MHVLMLPSMSPTDAVLEAEHPLQTLPEWVQGPFILDLLRFRVWSKGRV